MSYTKLDSGITDSTIWQAPDTTRLVWITLLSLADQHGYIGASVPGLASRARVSIDACVEALDMLKAPDKWSRTRDNEGRRIAEADGGWILLNHAKYREAKSADDRRERSRVAMAELRAQRKHALTVSTCDNRLSKLAQAEADTEEEAEATPSLRSGETLSPTLRSGLSGGLSAPPTPPDPTGVADAPPAVPAKSVVAKPRKPKPCNGKEPPPSADTWAAYAQAYAERYGVHPVRNAKGNSQFVQLVKRLGADEAPGVARAYLMNRNAVYEASKHCTDLLLRDAEKLRTEWATGNVTHQRDANEADRLSSTGAMWDRVEQKLAAKGIR